MGERTTYEPGTFCWADLSTTDPEGAKAFYAGVFGWDAEDMPMPDGGVYSMQRLDGKDVAAIAPQPPQQQGLPPVWNNYVWVEDADATVERARELGVEPHAGAFDVMDAGRMAVLQDPAGAYFLAWQARRHGGAALVNAPGALSWNELHTPDVGGAIAFYGELFGWTTEPMETPSGRYEVIRVGGHGNGGISDFLQEGVPPHWLTYFGADDVAATLGRVEEHGGATLMGEDDIGVGRIGIARDPQGGVFALYAGEFES